MGALATCTVSRLSHQKLDQPIASQAFDADETSYSAHILFFENAYAYVVKDSTKQLVWVPIKLITDVVPL